MTQYQENIIAFKFILENNNYETFKYLNVIIALIINMTERPLDPRDVRWSWSPLYGRDVDKAFHCHAGIIERVVSPYNDLTWVMTCYR